MELETRAEESPILGLSNLSPRDGESAEKRWCGVDSRTGAAVAEDEPTELVDDLRRPVNEIESRFDLRVRTLDDAEAAVAVDCRGTRDVDIVAGDARTDAVLTVPDTVLACPSSLSITPNSFADMLVGDGFVEDDNPLTVTLARRLLKAFFCMGEPTVDVRLEIRGILVGVSFGRPETEVVNDDGGGSLTSFDCCAPFIPVVPTEGDPAIVGSTLRARRELSDCFCMELTVCEVSLDAETVRVVLLGVVDGVELVEEVDLSRATRCAVAGSRADICKGGRLTGDFVFLTGGSVEDRVFPRFLPIRTDILLSLRSLSSFFCLSFSAFASLSFSFSASLAFCISLAASLESACKLLLEVDPFKRERTEDFLPGVDVDVGL